MAAAPTALIANSGPVSPSGTHHSSEAPRPGVLPRQKHNLRVVPFRTDAPPNSAIPQTVLFGGLRHPALIMRQAMPLRTETVETGGVSVVWDEGNEFGFGDTFGAAMDDFSRTISELYIELAEAQSLSQDLSAIREKLSAYIEVRRR
jgi:hypothetical protein